MNMRKFGAAGVIAAILVVVAVFALRGGESHKASPSTTPLRAKTSQPVLVKTVGAPPKVHAPASPSGITAAEWKKRFWAADKANDYLGFVKEALPAAQQGDGRAAWLYLASAFLVPARDPQLSR